MGWVGHITRIVKVRNAYKILVGKSEGKRPLGRPRYRLMGNVIMKLRGIMWEGVDWIHLALVNTVMNLWVP
jgi:hypothetical protein